MDPPPPINQSLSHSSLSSNFPCPLVWSVHSALGSGIFLILAGTVFQYGYDPLFLIMSLCLFMGFFSVGMGAITFVVASELFPLPVRGKAMALTVFVNRLLR